MDKNTYTCLTGTDLQKKCETLMPSGDGCVICKDKYYRVGQNCESCDVSCATCVNGKECVTCAPNYFTDAIAIEEGETYCLHYDELENCTQKT